MTVASLPPRPWPCVVWGCTAMIEPDELVYCPLHRRLVIDGVPAADLPQHRATDQATVPENDGVSGTLDDSPPTEDL